jgi:hypothetical protein
VNFCQNSLLFASLVLWIRIPAVVGLPAVVDLPTVVGLLDVDGFPTFITVTALSDVPKVVRILAAILLLLLKSLMLLTSSRIWLPT